MHAAAGVLPVGEKQSDVLLNGVPVGGAELDGQAPTLSSTTRVPRYRLLAAADKVSSMR